MRRVLLAGLIAAAAVSRAAAETNQEHLEAQAGSIWDAAHAKDPGRALTKEQRALFGQIEALAKIKSFTPKAVAKALGMTLRFETTDSDEYMDVYEARASSGSAIETVEVRTGHMVKDGGTPGIVILTVAKRLDVEPQDLMAGLGKDQGITGPGVHAGPGDPYYYHFARPGGALKLGFKPGVRHVLVDVVWDRDD